MNQLPPHDPPGCRRVFSWHSWLWLLPLVLFWGPREVAAESYPSASGGTVARIEPGLPSVFEQLAPAAWTVPAEEATSPTIEPAEFAPELSMAESACDCGFWCGYEDGFVVRPVVPEQTPFSLKVNNQNTFRYSGFARGASSWVDSAGQVVPITNSGEFLIPRGRLIFTGNALLPQLSYLLNIDYNTVGRNPIGFRAFALSYQFSRALEVSVGQNKVPGSREWILSSWVAQEGPDRSMATTFFRPSLSQGIWARGQPLDGVYYHAMLANGFNTLNLTPGQFSNRLCWSDSIWWEPWGDFGSGYADVEDHQQLVMRTGTSFTFAFGPGNQANGDSAENSALRLSDGTLISQTGALAPGVTLQRYDISLVAFDLAFKRRGFSVSSEFYFQQLSSLRGDGPLPFDSTSARGGFLQGGYFVLPQRVEVYARTSFVTGAYGSGTEIAGGCQWFVLPGKSNLRLTFDVADLESSPADQNRTGFVAGQTGVLFRTQINSSF